MLQLIPSMTNKVALLEPCANWLLFPMLPTIMLPFLLHQSPVSLSSMILIYGLSVLSIAVGKSP
jgi:hypothetical protein